MSSKDYLDKNKIDEEVDREQRNLARRLSTTDELCAYCGGRPPKEGIEICTECENVEIRGMKYGKA